MRYTALLSFFLCALGTLAGGIKSSRHHDDGSFVSVKDGKLVKDGSKFVFLGTNAYWLPALVSDEAIRVTLQSIAKSGMKVVRTWAFNDVDYIPDRGVWFQLIKDGKVKINDGVNGLQRLDKVVEFAEEAGLHVIFSLTNNWNPRPDLDQGLRYDQFNSSRPRNYLSNDYGGMDAYVRNLSDKKKHDEFYTNKKIIEVFKDYTATVIKRFVDNPTILGWEIGNDARCSSTLPASPNCNTHTITKWLAEISEHIHSVDPNHLISAGTHGFLCKHCPKLFPIPNKPNDHHWREIEGVNIRGRSVAALSERSIYDDPKSAFDGSFGVDSQDILNIPNIDYATFQLFPDQNSYGPHDPSLSWLENVIRLGVQWIELQADLAKNANKPSVMVAFGIVSPENKPSFVPFDSTEVLFSDSSFDKRALLGELHVYTTRDPVTPYDQWLNVANGLDVSSINHQWGQAALPSPGRRSVPERPELTLLGGSPNDGYRFAPDGSDGVLDLLTSYAPQFSE